MEHLEHWNKAYHINVLTQKSVPEQHILWHMFWNKLAELGENMKIIGLNYADSNNISFGDNWAIRVTSADDEFRTMKSVESIVFVPALGLFSKQDRRNYDTYEIKCFDGKTVSLPADKYMALYE